MLKTIKIFSNPIEAQLAKSQLESAEIECFLRDEQTISLNQLHANVLGGIKLDVHENDEAEAAKILNVTFDASKPTCQKCGSNNIVHKMRHKSFMILGIVAVGLPMPFSKTMKSCKDCRHSW